MEKHTREAVFNIERRKQGHFRSREENSPLKVFSTQEVSTFNVERNFFSQLARFRAFLCRKTPNNFFFFQYFSFTSEKKVVKEKEIGVGFPYIECKKSS